MHNPHIKAVSRRGVLRWLAVGPAALSLALRDQLALADALAVETLAVAPRELKLVNLHTGERAHVRYFDDGQYVPDALAQLQRLLRDHRSGESAPLDPRLYDQLHTLSLGAQCAPHFEIISGYRSPATNEKLRAGSSGVAKDSMHTKARALDVRPAQLSCSRLRDLALDLKLGGVGFYAKSNFVHIDTGRVRSWSG